MVGTLLRLAASAVVALALVLACGPVLASGGGGGGAPAGGPVFYDLPDMLVNLDTAGQRPAYLKIRVSIQLARAEDVPRFDAYKPRILDDFQVYLRELRLDNLKGSKSLDRLRQELLMRIKAAVRPLKVNDILFRELLVQ